jgi:biotin operon repressor
MGASMTVEEGRAALLQGFTQSRAALLAAIEGLTEEQMVEQSIGDWSVKDHLLHVAQWDEWRSFEIRRVSQGFQAAHPAMDPAANEALNVASTEQRRFMSVAQARWELEFSRSEVMAAIEQITEAGLDVSRYGEVGLQGGHEHELGHAETIQRWRTEHGY